jgi:hypothetical protein
VRTPDPKPDKPEKDELSWLIPAVLVSGPAIDLTALVMKLTTDTVWLIDFPVWSFILSAAVTAILLLAVCLPEKR